MYLNTLSFPTLASTSTLLYVKYIVKYIVKIEHFATANLTEICITLKPKNPTQILSTLAKEMMVKDTEILQYSLQSCNLHPYSSGLVMMTK